MPVATASVDGQVLASADAGAYEVVEGNVYFAPEAVNKTFLAGPTGTSTVCAWKGRASYYTVKVGDREVKDAAWFYPEPMEKAARIKDYVAFYKNKVDVVTDGPLQDTITR
ncbi:uncharacterized protein PV09_08239 [Verruconis gallopava]|uniref:DUF427 domain-containing protein n=1 Tax=Verruconis gallopava TaxID=253628 RepID=A0A0D2AM28_9PEZI|nr:uncharacterized protein PV09_08239 [Verruconis gallopava]KIW00199.1 hypothetical protein PV09_08239 [Verruconis gallopava]